MEVFLYNSTVCRLCGEENDSGTFLYSCEENNQNLSDLINQYMPIKVSDDGQLPRTICPGCTIQLEATVEFLNLIINGQKVIRELHQREKEYKKTILISGTDPEGVTENIVGTIDTTNGVYDEDHAVSLQVAGLERPKRKRGRPPKKPKSPEEIQKESEVNETEIEPRKNANDWSVTGKRRRKTPTRFKEAVQGKELERIFKEEGVIDGEESEEPKPEGEEPPPPSKEPEVIGHLEASGELVVVVKGKGRGRPKGRVRPTLSECLICGMTFSCVGRYMSHVAQHGAVRYRCVCGQLSDTRLQLETHQRRAAHRGHTVLPPPGAETVEPKTEDAASQKQSDSIENVNNNATTNSLPKLVPDESLVKEEQDPPSTMEELEVEIESMDTPSVDTNNVPEEKADDKVEEVIEVVGPKGKVKLKCNHCDKLFSSKQSKSLHIKAVHQGEKPYACAECGARFAYPRCLALHALSHRRRRAARRYACDLCGKVLNHPSSVVYHKEAEHAGQSYVCSTCGKSFKHRQLLQRHQLVHSSLRPYSCKTCNASFKTKANLLNHQLLHSGVKKFSCDICKHRFAHKTSLTLHMRWHTGSKPYSCDICGKSFSQKGNLSEHERIHTGEKPYQCAACPKRFTTSSQYRLHARKHQPEKPYQCTVCNKRFLSRSSWLTHTRREQKARSHWCGVCARAFPERWALAKHMRRHTGERPFRCPHCPRAFADCSNLHKHRKQVHKQISLLVNNEAVQSPETPAQEPQEPHSVELVQAQESMVIAQVPSEVDEMEERVIYVTYDVEDDENGFRILDPEQAASLETEKLFGASPLEVDDVITRPELERHMAVTDEYGNPLHFTMQDGTQLVITSNDGKSLQVITQDGQTIPVEINEFTEEDTEDSQEMVVQHVIEKTMDSTVSSPVTQYFTIV